MVSGYLRSADCGPIRAGVAAIHVAEVADVASFTKNPSGENWTAVTMVEDNFFKKYEFKQGEAELKMDLVTENRATKSTNSIDFNMDKLSQESRDAVQELADKSACGLIVIVTTNQNEKWVLGYDNEFGSTYYCEFKTGTGTSGKAMTDLQGFVNSIGNESVELPRTFSGSIPIA